MEFFIGLAVAFIFLCIGMSVIFFLIECWLDVYYEIQKKIK